ncbi:MAG: hypothetical protein U1B78_01230, partial [Dehalococcoidia bacterium]|nr:hypothetical protein [Dehalococcoidia bacterium]
MRLRKGLLALPIVLLATAAGCLPKPDEPVEFLARPDSVIIQLKRVDAPESPFAQRVAVPDLTLYGDGTLLLSRGGGSTLVQAQVPEDAIRDLLEFMEDEGFFNFRYEEPGANSAGGPAA